MLNGEKQKMNLRLSNNTKHIFNRKLRYEMKQDQFLIMFANISNDDKRLLLKTFKYSSSVKIDKSFTQYIADYQPLMAFIVKEDFQSTILKFSYHSLKMIETMYPTVPYSIRLDVSNFK